MAFLILKVVYRLWRGDAKSPNAAVRTMTLLAGLLLFSSGLFNDACSQPVSREYALKAVFLLNFAQLTTWPTNSFSNTNAPFTIGILGDDPFGPLLDETLRGETWHGRPFLVRRNLKLENVGDCQLLFITRSASQKAARAAAELKGKPVLTVADFEGVQTRETMIDLFTDRNRIRFKINNEPVKNSTLNVSSKLQRVAEMETPENH